MCSIIGAVLRGLSTDALYHRDAAQTLMTLFDAAYERGRDGRGFAMVTPDRETITFQEITRQTHAVAGSLASRSIIQGGIDELAMVSNYRAEPTTEFVQEKNPDDQQPYSSWGWHVVHNGTIANDKKLRTNQIKTDIDSAAIVETLGPNATFSNFFNSVLKLKGSYAILAAHNNNPQRIFAAANYRPIWYSVRPEGTYFASARHHFPSDHIPQMMPPYTAAIFTAEGMVHREELRPPAGGRALVVCSGGLDSVVAAAQTIEDGYHVELAHFQYGSRAEGPEVKAVQEVADYYGIPVHFIPVGIYDPADSPLLRADDGIAGGEAGAEFAHEWVPARNLVMLAIATAYAEAKGFDHLILGNNLEEAGAYPDNEPEFIARFNDLLPFAVADGKRLTVKMPVGNDMKHEIVAKGMAIGAPLHLTWSCYRAGEKHCGTCGPCFMRRTAFTINGLEEVIQYQNDEE